MRNAILEQVKDAIRNPYAWPGGYPVYTVLSDGAMLCPKCARENYKLIVAAERTPYTTWQAAGAEVYWEGPVEYCAQCNTELESAYGDPEEEES